ncbi:dATP pyrophosphohydrolase [Haemophilus influenzae 22.1-21]|uniref:dATP pyrophosphohydrolase n=1 Tax=Haemophilus influenzae 22.4-21 TaxID=375063 RepID=A4NW18_HAEIF|nr:dATP pyrophosphohydrolase [Haemophilus influenzae 22.1-21]EDK14709.1 dATP pyrophosphohydrolase [Haemophilus influenzae 22.4-21]
MRSDLTAFLMMQYKNNQSVLVVIYTKDTNRVLMLQRQDDPDFWQSVTGTIESGETPKKQQFVSYGKKCG